MNQQKVRSAIGVLIQNAKRDSNNYPEVPREIAGKVKTINVKTYDWNW